MSFWTVSSHCLQHVDWRNLATQNADIEMNNYTHKGVEFWWGGGLNLFLKNEIMPLKPQLNNGSLSWRLNRRTWISVNQLKKIKNANETQPESRAGTGMGKVKP